MIGTVTLDQAMQYCGFPGGDFNYQNNKLFFHCVRIVAPAFDGFVDKEGFVTDEPTAPESIWNDIRDAVKERVRLEKRGGIHYGPDGEHIDTDEEFAYNRRIKKQLAKQVTAGEFLDDGWFAIKESVNAAQRSVASEIEGGTDLDAVLDHLALLYLAHWGHQPWNTRQAVLDGTFDFSPLT